jgi:hypothetical protein
MLASPTLNERSSEAAKQNRRSPIMKRLSGPYMEILSACGKNAWRERRTRGADALSGARASGRHTHRKRPVRNALTTAGVKNVGEIREASDATLLSLQDLRKGSVAHLRKTLGLPSTDGVTPLGKKPT